jgi:HAE1 family hydrophobic/amphiphilic exporter-1
MTLTEFSFKKPVLIVSMACLLLILGISTYPSLPSQMLPNISIPIFYIETKDAGLDASSVHEKISLPLERAFHGLEGLNYTESESYTGLSTVLVMFKVGTNVNQAYEDVERKLNAAIGELPAKASKPVLRHSGISDFPIVWVLVETQHGSFMKGNEQLIKSLEEGLEALPGVADIKVSGTIPQKIIVSLNQKKMSSMGIPMSLIYQAFQTNNVVIPGGNIDFNEKSYALSLDLELKSLSEIKNLIVTYRDNKPIYLSQIAEVKTQESPGNAQAFYNGQNVVAMSVTRMSNANTLEVISRVNSHIAKAQESAPDGIKISTRLSKEGSINESADSLRSAAIVALFFAALVLYLFLGSLRLSAIIMVIVPMSLLTALFAMGLFGLSFNVLSYLSLILLIGIVVDDAIIVIENYMQGLKTEEKHSRLMTIATSNKIAPSIFAYSVTLCIIFVSALFVDGMVKLFFREMSIIIVSGVVASSLIALSITPLLCDRYLQQIPDKNNLTKVFMEMLERCKAYYLLSLVVACRHRKKLCSIFILMLVPLAFVLPKTNQNLFPPGVNHDKLIVHVSSAAIIPSKAFIDLLLKADGVVKANIDVSKTIAVSDRINANKAKIYVLLKPSEQRKKSSSILLKELEASLQTIPGLFSYVSNPPMLSGNPQPLDIVITGKNYRDLLLLNNRLTPILLENKDLFGKVSSMNPPLQATYKLVVDRYAAAQVGLNAKQIAEAVSLYSGQILVGKTELDENGLDYDIYLYPQEDILKTPADINSIYLYNQNGAAINLSTVARLEIVAQPTKIFSHNAKTALEYYSTPMVSLGEAIKSFVEKITPSLDSEQEILALGEFKMMQQSLNSLSFAVLIAIFLIYIALCSQFNSFSQPLILFISQPVAIALVIYVLYVTGIGFNLFSIIGLFLLIGIKTKNFILLISAMNQHFEKSNDAVLSAIEACRVRFTPIIMTSLIIFLSMLPTLFTGGEQHANNVSMGLTIVAGILSSTVLSLYFIPICYIIFKGKHG